MPSSPVERVNVPPLIVIVPFEWIASSAELAVMAPPSIIRLTIPLIPLAELPATMLLLLPPPEVLF